MSSPELPVIPLRGVVVFPQMVASLFVGRPRSSAALEAALAREDKIIALVAQINARDNDPGPGDLYDIACLARVDKVLRLPDGTMKVSVEGLDRVRVQELGVEGEFLTATVSPLSAEMALGPVTGPEADEQVTRLRAAFEAFARISRRVPPEVVASVISIEDPGHLTDMVAAHMGLKVGERQQILALLPLLPRLDRLLELIEAETEVATVERRIRKKVGATEGGKSRAAMGQSDGGEADEFKNELTELAHEIGEKDLPEEARDRLEREFRKLKMMNPMSAESGVLRTYIDWVLSLPWGHVSKDALDIVEAQRVLDADHYGLEKAKDRIVEYLAVQQLTDGASKGPILCLAGPPGVGKTSLARSIAHATGRKFVRISLGGVRDEAEIRGHRRTYVGALPGKIIHALKKAGTSNPVILLDEVDKMSADFRGGPSSALLEVLDRQQNDAFVDHYIDLDYDLSKVLFVTTANYLQAVPVPLLDRLEIIELGGYTEQDKMQIARQYLVPRQVIDNGLQGVDVKFSDETLALLIGSYTREAGVRSLERQIGSVCRKLARETLESKRKRKRFRITPDRARELLGAEHFTDRAHDGADRVGVVNGLAVTSVGGDILQVEVAVLPGKGKLTFTGKLGDVMQESVQAAMSYVRARAGALELDKTFYENVDVHVHFPEGAVPKDGPSAGIAIATGLVSALTRIPVRYDVAMTGEVTLRGRVLAIGGLKQKIIAAHRAGIFTALVPKANERHVEDIPKEVLKDMTLIFVEHADDVLRNALRIEDQTTFLTEPFGLSREYLGIYVPPTAH